jgi:hypothetical protein
MKGLSRESLIKILEMKNYEFYLESDIEAILKVFGDDYYLNRDSGKFELTKKNNKFNVI